MKMNSVSSGLLAGVFATVCMSAVMLTSKKLGLQGEHAPKRIVQGSVKRMGKAPPRGKRLSLLTTVAHFGFGMAGGAGFSAMRRAFGWQRLAIPGVIYGLAVWWLSYKGWVPKMGLLPRPEEDRTGRVATMIAGHGVYGATLGLALKKLEDS